MRGENLQIVALSRVNSTYDKLKKKNKYAKNDAVSFVGRLVVCKPPQVRLGIVLDVIPNNPFHYAIYYSNIHIDNLMRLQLNI